MEELKDAYPSASKTELKVIHYQQKHNDKISHCIHPSCQKAFVYQGQMKSHYQRVHLKQRKQCLYCPKSFSAKELLRLHTEDNHPEKVSQPLTFKCEFNSACKAKFTAHSMLRLHLNSRHGVKNRNAAKKICTHCGKSFS